MALLTTLLAQRQAFHRAVLVEKMGAIAPATLSRLATLSAGFQGKGFTAADAQQKALTILGMDPSDVRCAYCGDKNTE